LLLTGAGGFIGSHVLRHLLSETDWDLVATDSFRHKGKTDRISYQTLDLDLDDTDRLKIVTHDLAAPISPQMAKWIGDIDFIIAMASESHVDRSIDDPAGFIRNNVNVILSTLDYARQVNPAHVIVISTDEVYGPVAAGQAHAEWAPILPSNPYAASKAAQEAIAISYWRTYGLPITIVNCMNLIGEMQDREKYLPKVIATVRDGGVVPVHGTSLDIGTRHYLHARNLADALLYILRDLPAAMFATHFERGYQYGMTRADRPDRYNIAGPDRVSNLELAQMVADSVGRPLQYELIDFHSTRPGHDPHYGLDPGKLTGLGWKPPVPFAESLERTVRWTLRHPEWLLP
jgi:dTDP-glucose 4,6-dehydratase